MVLANYERTNFQIGKRPLFKVLLCVAFKVSGLPPDGLGEITDTNAGAHSKKVSTVNLMLFFTQ